MARYFEYVEALRAVCQRRKFALKKIGSVGRSKEYPLYAVTLKGRRPRRTICFAAGVHGDEGSGPEAVLEFLKIVEPGDFSGLKVILLAVANPYGFDRGQRRGSLGQDINRHFSDRRLVAENKILYDFVKNEKIFIFISFHEDDVNSGFYICPSGDPLRDFYQKLISEVAKIAPLTGRGRLYRWKIRNGYLADFVPDGSFEGRLRRDGALYSLATETPDRLPIKRQLEVNLKVIFTALAFAQRT